MARDDQMNSVIGEGSVFEGQFYIAGSLKIDGKFEGEIKTDDMLVIGERGRVKTNIDAKNVLISGTLIGDIEATNEVRLSETGKMVGDIQAPSIHVAKGVLLKGSVTITGGQKKDIEKIVLESFGVNRTD
ncbi:MAG: polymer-forming cytoskeletal protein [Leptospirales bacterium]